MMQKTLYSFYCNLQTAGTYIYNGYLKSKLLFWILNSRANHIFSHLTGATLQNDVRLKFQFQRLGSLLTKS